MFTISQILHCSVQCRTTKAASKHAQFCQVVLFIRNCTHPRTLFRIFMKSSSEIVKNLKLGCASFSNFSLFLQTISFKFWKEYSDIVQFHIKYSLYQILQISENCFYSFTTIKVYLRWYLMSLFLKPCQMCLLFRVSWCFTVLVAAQGLGLPPCSWRGSRWSTGRSLCWPSPFTQAPRWHAETSSE